MRASGRCRNSVSWRLRWDWTEPSASRGSSTTCPRPIERSIVVVHASTRPEPFGLVIPEAMSCGRAVLATRTGGASELFDDGVQAAGIDVADEPSDDPRPPRAAGRSVATAGAGGSRTRARPHPIHPRSVREPARRRAVAGHAGCGGWPMSQQPVSVLHVHSGNLFGGVERVMETLVAYAPGRPLMTSAFALCFEGRLSRTLRDAGAVVHELGETHVRRPAEVLRARRRLARGAGRPAATMSRWFTRRGRRRSSGPRLPERACRSCGGSTRPMPGRAGWSSWRADPRPAFALYNSRYTMAGASAPDEWRPRRDPFSARAGGGRRRRVIASRLARRWELLRPGSSSSWRRGSNRSKAIAF